MNTHPPAPHPTLYPLSSASLLSASLEVLFPRSCLVCQRPIRRESLCYRCKPCLPTLEHILQARCHRCFSPLTSPNEKERPICEPCLLFPSQPDSIRFVWDYSGLARDFIRSMKYRPSPRLARMGGHVLASCVEAMYHERDWDLCVPVPSSHSTFRKRLFHPCVEMANLIARHHELPLKRALRHDPTRDPQASLQHEARLRRLRSLFSIPHGARLSGARILLVEDVITTGATISAATYALKRAGAARVDVLALARTRVWTRFRKRLNEIFA